MSSQPEWRGVTKACFNVNMSMWVLFQAMKVQANLHWMCACLYMWEEIQTTCAASLCWLEVCVWHLSAAASVERLRRFQDRNLQGHRTWLRCWTCHPSLPDAVTRRPPKNSCGYLRSGGATGKMRSGRGGEMKRSRSDGRPPEVLVCCALRTTRKASDRQAERPERSSCQAAAELHVAVLLD